MSVKTVYKSPKIQRLITETRLRRKSLHKKEVKARYTNTKEAHEKYEKLLSQYAKEQKSKRDAEKKVAEVVAAPVKAAPVKVVAEKVAKVAKVAATATKTATKAKK
jgi:small subunit ribosomal protein S6e